VAFECLSQLSILIPTRVLISINPNPSIHPIDQTKDEETMKKERQITHTTLLPYEPYLHRLVYGARDVVVVLSDIETPDATRMHCFQHRRISLPENNVDAFSQ